MGPFIKGDVVVMPFPFADLSGAKRRPALVVAVLETRDVVLCQITSHNRRDAYSVPLMSADFTDGDLRRSSWIRPNRLFTADPEIVLYRVGHITDVKLAEVVEKVVKIMEAS